MKRVCAGARRGSGHVGRRSHGRERESGSGEAGAGHRDSWRFRAAATAAGDGVHLGWQSEAESGDSVRASRRLKENVEGYVLHTSNCPYHHLKLGEGSASLCDLDLRLVASLLGVVPRRLSHVAHGGETCSYLIPE